MFDVTKNQYLLLTLNGAFSVETKETTTEPEETLFYDEENNAKLHKVIDKYYDGEYDNLTINILND